MATSIDFQEIMKQERYKLAAQKEKERNRMLASDELNTLGTKLTSLIELENCRVGSLDKIYWGSLSQNPTAIHLLEMNFDKIDWNWLS